MKLAVFERSGRSSSKRIAISALAVAVVVFVAIGIAVEVVFLPKSSQQTAAATGSAASSASIFCSAGGASCPAPSQSIQDAVNQWVGDFNSRNVAGLGNFYAQDSVVSWTGQASGLAGVYKGQGNVRILYGSSIGKTTSLNASIANYNAKPVNQDNQNVTLTLNMVGNSSVVGALNIKVAVVQQWNYVGGSWQIVQETWNYLTFQEQFPVSSTTFPQWTALKLGQNPNLVSEKSFEWNAGPYVALSVYAFLGGVVAIGFMMYRRRSRPS